MKMAKEFAEYLSANVLNDGQTVSYRTLSRALKVHSNLAKQMLFDFYQTQNSKKPGTLHATYLISGKQKVKVQQQTDGIPSQDGQDTDMHSSPLPSSVPEPRDPVDQDIKEYMATTVTLVDQDHLDNAKSQFDDLISIHVYSIQPGKLNVSFHLICEKLPLADGYKDLQVLTECNRAIATTYATEDPLETSKQYGTIQNSHVKRRAFRRQQPQPAQNPAPSTTTNTSKPASTFVSSKPSHKDDPKGSKPTKPTTEPAQDTAVSSAKPSAGKPAPVKRESSSLFKAFAKAKPKAQSQTAEGSAETPESNAKEDEPMRDLSDEEADEEDAAMFNEGALTEPSGKTKKEREEELRRMMEMEDEPMVDAPAESPAVETPEATNADSQPKEGSETKKEPTETVIVSDGRRRGKRRIMKKKTVKDDEGYLVTREEAAWESFSEEEPALKKPKVSVAPPAAKAKKGASKGQGNIMSFFSKK